MKSFDQTPLRIAIPLLFSAWLAAGCSGSSESGSPVGAGEPGTDEMVGAGSENVSGAGELEDDTDGAAPNAEDVGETSLESGSESGAEAPGSAGSDPLVQTMTSVQFDITVPAHVSDALQVRVVWGNKDIAAQWVGDEFWSATADFLSGEENLLVVTFYDGNGEITLGSVEQSFRPGTGDLEVFTITADDFDTDQWDSDADGVSNIDELSAGTDPFGNTRILLFSETQGFRHDSISNALEALEELALSVDIQVDQAGDSAGVFTEANLANYDAVVWTLTSGDVLNADEQTAFENYIRSGGGYAGIHAASDTEYEWPWYGTLVGAYFDRHPLIQSATQAVEDDSHPSTSHLNSTWTRTDEWYDYRSNPRARVNVLLTLDEDSYSDGGMGEDHPSAWYHEHDGGRSWYTGGGHTESSYSEPDFRAHLLGGLRYAAGLTE